MRAIAAISEHPDTRTAALELAAAMESELEGNAPAAILLLASFHHGRGFAAVAEIIGSHLQPQALVGGTAQTVFAGLEAPDRRSGLAAFALQGETLTARAFLLDWELGPAELATPTHWRNLALTGENHAATIVLADPFTTAPGPILKAIDEGLPGPLGGGLLSGSTKPGCNILIADRMQTSTGVVGIGIGGPIRCEMLVSQGCRPIGEPMIVTATGEGRVLGLGGRPAAEAARETILALNEADRELVSHGLRLGLAMSEFREHFGSQDFLVREITGVDDETGALQVAERPAVGRTVQFLVRDPEAAEADLDLALDVQLLDETPPLGVLLAESSVRGMTTADLQQLRARLGDIPVAGLVCAGEFAPWGERTVLHGASASAMIFRSKDR